jgi:hypothetical protein
MVSAILLAGYNNKRAVKKYSRMVAEHYGEEFIEAGYKPLRDFEITEDGKKIIKPVIQFTLEKLYDSELIDEIIIVGHRMLLEQRLDKVIKKYKKPCKIINQNARIPQQAVNLFDIDLKKVKHNSLAGNFIKGYTASKAFNDKKHVLIVASDSPMTTKEYIKNFITISQDYIKDSALIVPAVYIQGKKDRLGRRPLFLRNDTKIQVSDKTDKFGRQGFRLSSLMYINPNKFDINSTNTAYNLRKTLNPKIQLKLFNTTRELGYKNVYSKYFIKKDLSIKETAKITSSFFKGKVTIIPIDAEESTYDYDGTKAEYQGISNMLKKRKG